MAQIDSQAVVALMTAAVAAHKANNVAKAEQCYREALALGPHPGAAILLANLLLSTNVGSAEYNSRRVDALILARASVQGIEKREDAEKMKLYARYAYFLLQYTGYVQFAGEQPTIEMSPEQKSKLLAEAISCLEKVTVLKPGYTLAWRNLTLAYTSADRLIEAEQAARQAVKSAGPACHWELHYKHGKALKRVGKHVETLEKYCDACVASNGAEVVMYWLRIADFAPPAGASQELKDRIKSVLASFGAKPDADGAGSTFVPHEYVRKLFDGYSKKFDEHLTQHLGYKTPHALLQLALAALPQGLSTHVESLSKAASSSSSSASASSQSSSLGPVWRRCADLGCGTGLAGVEFKPFCGYMSGCDLSGGMVAEARVRTYNGALLHSALQSSGSASSSGASSSTKRPLYDLLDADEIEDWLVKQISAGGGSEPDAAASAAAQSETSATSTCPQHPSHRHVASTAASAGAGYDLVVSADVLVYIGPLEGVFKRTAEAMVPTGHYGPVGTASSTPARADAGTEGESCTCDAAAICAPSLFVFSTEALGGEDGSADSSPSDGPGYALTATGRCVHSRRYIKRLASDNGFVVRSITRQPIRKNAGVDVIGDLYVLERVAAT